ncbi:MAG: hypothetical protein NPIRA04_18230 [Nitrospirales bacterium]|nr:MAG: hypothetical protein NPIRA04_18230 [Nitrospirales bacterium]
MGKPVIKSNSVIKSGGKFIELVQVCNESDRTETLWVTSWPWEKGKRKKKPNKKTGQKVTLKKGECKTLRFEHTKRPYQYYTDLYRYMAAGNHQGLWLGFNINIVKIFDLDAFLEQIRKALPWSFWILAFLPYPMRLEPSGKRKRVAIREVHGLPDGWKVSCLHPEVGQALTLEPNQKNDQLLLQIEACKPDSDLERVDLTIEAGVVGQRNSAFNRIPIGLTAVRKHSLPRIIAIECRRDPEYPHLQFLVDVEDEQGLLETPEILYSTDGGESWLQEDMELVETFAFTDLGLGCARFRAWVPLPGIKAKALVGFVANDQLGNTNSTAIERWPKQKT